MNVFKANIITLIIMMMSLISCTGKESEAKVIKSETTRLTSETKAEIIDCAGCSATIDSNRFSKTEVEKTTISKPMVTFIELGSVNCIPCKQMQPVMEAIEEKYGIQLMVIFYDVWKAEQKKYAQKYGIKLIPTQIFLDENGKEFHRHEGFYPESEIDKVLQSKGLKPGKNGG